MVCEEPLPEPRLVPPGLAVRREDVITAASTALKYSLAF